MFALPFLPISVSVNNGIVTVKNINVSLLHYDIYREFNAIRITTYMVKETGWFSMEFYEFFALEFYHILEVLKNVENLKISVGKLRQLQRAVVENTWLKRIFEKHPDIMDFDHLKMFKFKPLPLQMEFLRTFNETLPKYGLKGMLLAGVPGSGKTFTSLAAMECLGVDLVVVFCPKNAVEQVWQASISGEDSVYKKKPHCWVKAGGKTYADQRYLVYHYEAIKTIDDLEKHFQGKKIGLIVDESHNLNEMTAERTQLYIAFCQKYDVRYVIPASGTPFKAVAKESIPFFKVMDPLFTDDVCEVFKKIYHHGAGILTRRLNMVSFKIPDSALNLEEPLFEDIRVKFKGAENYTLKAIAKRMQDYATRRALELQQLRPEYVKFYQQMLKDYERSLGAVADADMRAELLEELARYRLDIEIILKAYDHRKLITVLNEMGRASWFEKKKLIPSIVSKDDRHRLIDILPVVKYPDLKIRGECLGRVLGRARVDAHIELSKHIDYAAVVESTDKKTLVFTTFIEVVDSAVAATKKLGYYPESVCGEKTKDLPIIVDKFKTDPKINPLCATYASLSTAVRLTEADTIMVLNPPYREFIMKQTIARTRRIGATTRTRVFNYIIDTGEEVNISTRGFDIVAWSREEVLRMFDIEDTVAVRDGVEYSTDSIVFAAELQSGGVLDRW